MRKILSLILTAITVIMAKANIDKPDFAYPKTVSKDAHAQLKEAIDIQDGALALNALIQIYVADGMIDPASVAQSIKTAESTAAAFEGDALSGVFDAFIAKLYYSAYSSESWKYDRRELPMEPLPADITEWSGDQYRSQIKKWVNRSISQESIDRLKNLKITDYRQVIEADSLTALYYPKLSDFVYSNALKVINNEDAAEQIIRTALTSSQDPGSKIIWQYQLDNILVNTNGDGKDYELLLSSYQKYADINLSGILLENAGQKARTIEEKKDFKVQAETFMKHHPKGAFYGNIHNLLARIEQESVNVNFPNYCGVGMPIKVSVSNSNAKNYTVKAYWLTDKSDDLDNNKKRKSLIENALNKDNAECSVRVECKEEKPFEERRTVELTLGKPGYYLIIGVPDGQNTPTNTYYTYTRCVPVIPVVINTDQDYSQVITTHPATGAPISDAKVSITNKNNKEIFSASPNASGITDIKIKNWSSAKLNVTLSGKEYDFRDLYINGASQTIDEELSCMVNILTDRSLYHPGDEINTLGVFYSVLQKSDKSVERSLIENTKVRFELKDSNWQPVDTIETMTDNYGRATAKFTAPTEGLTGQYQIMAYVVSDNKVKQAGRNTVMISDYKMPEYELKINAIECDTPRHGDVTITGEARSYSGMPMSDVTITLKIRQSSWWGFNWQYGSIYTTEIKTDADGRFTAEVNDSVFAENKAFFYLAALEGVSNTGSTATVERSFALTAKYTIDVNLADSNVNGEKPLRPEVSVLTADGTPTEIALTWAIYARKDNATSRYERYPREESSEEATVVASGDYYGPIDISKIKPGSYVLHITSKEKDLANDATADIVIYNKAMGIVPDDKILWLQNRGGSIDNDGQIHIQLATGSDKTYLYYMLASKGEILSTQMVTYDYGYHTLDIKTQGNATEYDVKLVCVKDGNTYTENYTVKGKKDTTLRIEGESFRDNLIPGAYETWRMRVVRADGQPLEAAMALDMYNKALEALVPHNFGLSFSDRLWHNGQISLSTMHTYNLSNSYRSTFKSMRESSVNSPEWVYFDYGMMTYGSISRTMGRPQVMKSMALRDDDEEEIADQESDAMVTGSVKYCMQLPSELNDINLAEVAEESFEEEGATEAFDYRDSDVPMAIWAPALTTDAEGNICYSFTVPNANTTWRLQAVAWSQDMRVGSLVREFVASKPVMVQPNLPRYLRNGDKATVLARVMNNSDETQEVTTTIELFNPLNGKVLSTRISNDTIAAQQTAVVGIDVEASDDMGAIGYRVRVSNGQFSDGEQNVIPILTSMSQLIETEPFYLNPGETSYSAHLPSDAGARITLTFCENPAWTIVSALPGLRENIYEYANSAAAALFSASISGGIAQSNPAIGKAIEQWKTNPTDSALISMLEKNQDLKIALLNATPWVQASQSDTERMSRLSMIFDDKEIDASISKAMDILKDLQNSDGGWSWSKWCDDSSPWVTSNVLEMMGELRRLGWLPNDKNLHKMIDKAVKYYDRIVEDTDLLYALTRPMFGDIAISANGKNVINATIKDIKKNWKRYTDPAYKAMAAEALWLNGEKSTAKELMKSVSEFGVYTKSQGLKFPSVNALYTYAILLEAYAMITPDSQEVDGLRQQLIARKQATDWGDAVVTSEVVTSILLSGAQWLVPAHGAEITVGDTVIAPNNAIETATGSLTANLSDYAGKELTITTTGEGPSYGAVFSQLKRKMTDVEASSCDDLDIEKQLYVRTGANWRLWQGESLQVGDRVKVQLTIHSKRNLQYVSIEDERPAAFEPVEQLPGWMWSEGVGFYRENRDSKTDLHVVYMRPGTYLLTYEMNVNLAGEYSSGVATIQSQYAPELSAHSSGSVLTVE